jgi:hypothetical protein
MWVDDTEYDPLKLCTLCDKPYGSSQAIFKTPCDHLFHNNCLNEYCEKNNNNICPVCGKDIGYSCTDVYAFKEKLLGDDKGNPLFEGNEKILNIYEGQEGGKKRRAKKRRTKRNRTKRSRNKRNRNKRMRTKRHFRVKK